MVDNSFFEIDYTGKRAALFVPHQDDETNLFPSLLSALSSQGAEVFVVYMTNGDWKFPAEKRFEEALAALSLLGVKEDHVIFMGYGDGLNDPSHSHMFYAEDEPAVSPAGHDHTYGTDAHPDYAFSRRGEHSPYTRKAYTEDLRSVMLELKADLLLCCDLDQHADHRMLSICFDEALGRILKEVSDYRPEVIKGLAYATAYTAVPDLFSVLNMSETKRPQAGKTAQYHFDLLGTSYYDWDARIRFPLVPEARSLSLKKNLIGRALRCHRSQQILRRADRIINSDEVGFRRRTDSLSYTAHVSASSGDPSKLNDFVLVDAVDIDPPVPVFGNCLWTPDPGDAAPRVTFSWDTPQKISRIVLYGPVILSENGDDSGEAKGEHIEFDSGLSLMSGPIPLNGKPVVIDLETPQTVKQCLLTLEGTGKSFPGLAECEFYEEAVPVCRVLHPFIKITLDDAPAYEYLAGTEELGLDLGVYSYGTHGSLRMSIVSGNAEIRGGKLLLSKRREPVRLRAEAEAGGETVWDEALILRAGALLKAKRKLAAAAGRGEIVLLKIKKRVTARTGK